MPLHEELLPYNKRIEESILALHGRKRDLADSLLEGTASASRMGVEEMMDLLREG